MLKRPLLATLVLLCASACVVGAPPGFSSGDLWTVPLVAPLENDLLLVPVSINGEGPFLFMVDPDSPTSSIESSLQSSLKLFASRAATQAQNEDDHLVRVVLAEVRKLTVGTLSVRNMKVRVHDDATFWSGGRRVRGILGRDVISDSLIYSFDRDRGMMYIGTQGNLKTPEDAQALSFSQSYSQHRRYLASFKINQKHKVTMHLDLGARTSMLWPALIKKFKLPTLPIKAELVDEYGTRRIVDSGTMAGILTSKNTEDNAVLMVPYRDKRLEPEDLDGIIGQNFWSKFNVTINWHHKKFWLQKRAEQVAPLSNERIARWGDQLQSCEHTACVKVEMRGGPQPQVIAPASTQANAATTEATDNTTDEATDTDAPPADGTDGTAKPVPAALAATEDLPYSLHMERAAPGTEFAYDVVIGAVDAKGNLLNLPVFLASFRSGLDALAIALDPKYGSAAGFVVLDMNPVGTRGCQGNQCVYKLDSLQRGY